MPCIRSGDISCILCAHICTVPCIARTVHTHCAQCSLCYTLLAHWLLHTACYTLLEALCGPDCSQGSSQANQLLSPGELEWSEPGEELIDTPLSPILNWNRWTLEHAKEKRRKKMDTGHWKTQGKNWTLEQTQEKSWTVTLEKSREKAGHWNKEMNWSWARFMINDLNAGNLRCSLSLWCCWWWAN